MAISAGETLSLNNLAGATGDTQNSDVSLGSIKGSPSAGDNISLSSFGIDGVGSLSGFTYAVEDTSETYTLGFTVAGSNFTSKIASRHQNLTWSVTPAYNSALNTAGYLSIGSNSDYTAVISVGGMNPQGAGSQTSLSGVQSHTLSATFNDGFNDHADNYNTARTKTVYSVDSYDGNNQGLCLTIDSPVILEDGTVVEVGDVDEGDILKGYALNGLSDDEYSEDFFEWETNSLVATLKPVTIVNLTYSFTSKYYSLNDGEITATAEHPLLVKDNSDDMYRFKEIFRIDVGDKLIKGDGTEVDVTSNQIIAKTSEIVSVDVEEQDTYLVNGYITHNKGSNTFAGDFTGPGAPTALAYSSPFISWTAPSSVGSTGITAYNVQVDNNSDFSSPIIDETEWSDSDIEVDSLLSSGTYHARVAGIDQGLTGTYATLEFTVA